MINEKVYNVISYDGGELEIFFTGDIVSIYKDKLKKVKRPPNAICIFEWFYKLKIEDDKFLGYIGLKKEEVKKMLK